MTAQLVSIFFLAGEVNALAGVLLNFGSETFLVLLRLARYHHVCMNTVCSPKSSMYNIPFRPRLPREPKVLVQIT